MWGRGAARRVVPSDCEEKVMCASNQPESAACNSGFPGRQQRLAEIEAVYARAPVGLCVVDRELRFVHVNERMAEINGLGVSEHLGRTVREVLPHLADELEPQFRSVLDTGKPVLRREIRGTTPALPGVERHWLASCCPLRDGDRVVAVNVVVMEVTEQMRAQEILRESEERLRIALEGNSEGVWDWDIRKGPAVFSAGYSRMLGYEPEEFARDYDTWRTLVHPDDIGRVDRAHAEHIYGNKPFRVELRMRKKNGDWCWILSRGAVVERDAEGHALRMIGTHMDITEHKLAEAEKDRLHEQLLQAQKLETVGRLAGGIAHDFNNLLTVINGYSDLLLREVTPNDPHHELLSEIRKIGRRAAGLTRQLLAFSRKQILHPQPLIIDAVVHEMHQMIARLLGEDVQLRMVLNARDAAIFADPGQIDQVVMNLVVNARDAMPDGGTLTIQTEQIEIEKPGEGAEPDSWVAITVMDTGVGMDEETQSHLFEPYFTTKDTGKGTGLGLSTIHGIIAQSGGRIEVESAPGAGATFRIWLPKMEQQLPAARSYEPALDLFGTETVVVVEDEPEVRAYTAAALKAYGYRVFMAENAQSAMEVFRSQKEHIDLVVTDLVMPGMSGKELAGKLAALHPSVKVLYVSGYSSDMVARRGVLEEGLVLVEKPFSPEQLAQKVREVLGRPHDRILAVVDGEMRTLLRNLLADGGYQVVDAADPKQVNAVDLIVTEVPTGEQDAIETVRELRETMPGVPVVAILDASRGRFLEMERLLAADAVIAKPISSEFLLKTVGELLRKQNPI